MTVAMTAAESAGNPSVARPFTRKDLDGLPDDGRRHELIDGALLVTPAPGFDHQSMSAELFMLLRAACPPALTVLYAPFDVVLAVDTVVQPDLLVAPRVAFTSRDLPVAPLLAVEILSPSTRRIDLMLKRSRYEAAGCDAYWVVDPTGPSITAWELADGGYRVAGQASGDEVFRARSPFEVSVVPRRLLG